MNAPRRAAAGFTYIEVVISILLIGILLVASAALVRGVPLSRDARDQDLALRIADNKLQSLRAAGYGNTGVSGPFADPDLSALASSSAAIVVSAYNASTTQVNVSVNWESQAGAARSLTLTTLITQKGGLP